MNHDIASELTNVRPSSYGSAQRRLVFVPARIPSHHHSEMTACWLARDKDSEFISNPARAAECAICIYTPVDPPSSWELDFIRAFFQRHGTESNVFEYSPGWGNFRRIDAEEFNLFHK